MITCEECNGTGYILYDGCGDEVLEVYHKENSKKACTLLGGGKCDCVICKDTCGICSGSGEVEEESYEPDPDEEYERKRDED